MHTRASGSRPFGFYQRCTDMTLRHRPTPSPHLFSDTAKSPSMLCATVKGFVGLFRNDHTRLVVRTGHLGRYTGER